MVTYLNVITESRKSASFTAVADHIYICDTSAAAFTITMPTGVQIGSSIIIKNAPVNGFQVGGSVTGHTLTINPGAGETIEGSGSDSLGPPTGTNTEATRQYWPTGANSGSGAGQAGFTGWCH